MKFSKKLVLAAILAISGGNGLVAAVQPIAAAQSAPADELLSVSKDLCDTKKAFFTDLFGRHCSYLTAENSKYVLSVIIINASSPAVLPQFKGLPNEVKVASIMKAMEETLFVDLKNAFATKALAINRDNCDFVQAGIRDIIANSLMKLVPSFKDAIVKWANTQAKQFSVEALSIPAPATVKTANANIAAANTVPATVITAPATVNTTAVLGVPCAGVSAISKKPETPKVEIKANPSKLNPLNWVRLAFESGEASASKEAESYAKEIADNRQAAKVNAEEALKVEKIAETPCKCESSSNNFWSNLKYNLSPFSDDECECDCPACSYGDCEHCECSNCEVEKVEANSRKDEVEKTEANPSKLNPLNWHLFQLLGNVGAAQSKEEADLMEAKIAAVKKAIAEADAAEEKAKTAAEFELNTLKKSWFTPVIKCFADINSNMPGVSEKPLMPELNTVLKNALGAWIKNPKALTKSDITAVKKAAVPVAKKRVGDNELINSFIQALEYITKLPKQVSGKEVSTIDAYIEFINGLKEKAKLQKDMVVIVTIKNEKLLK